MKPHGGNVNTKIQVKEVSKECLSLIMLDSFIKVNIKVLPSNTFRRLQVLNK